MLIIDVHLSIAASMNVSPEPTYTGSIPKRPDITGAPNQVFKFDNFLDSLIGGIRGNTVAAIGTINPGLLCIQYLYAPQIHYNLSSKPIVFIRNLSKKEGAFSLIKINVASICLFSYIKDKTTMDSALIYGDEFPNELLSSTDWADFTDPIVGTLMPNFFITYSGKQLVYGDLSDNDVMAKLTCLGFGYKLWANIYKEALKQLDDTLTIMEKVNTPERIMKCFNPIWDRDKSLPLATVNGPFGIMAIVQSKDYPVAACTIKDLFRLTTHAVTNPEIFPQGNIMLQLPGEIDKESKAKASSS